MATWARLRLVLEHADNSTYARARTYGSLQSYASQDEHYGPHSIIEAATAAGTTIELGNFTTINLMIVENLSTTSGETVNVRWTNASDSTASRVTLPIAATSESAFMVVQGVDPATDLVLVAASGTPACRITVFGT